MGAIGYMAISHMAIVNGYCLLAMAIGYWLWILGISYGYGY
jgi:hypothetical protein